MTEEIMKVSATEGTMKLSMDGLRRNLSGDAERLRAMALDILNGETFDEEDFMDVVNDVIRESNVLNCVFHTEDPDFNDMSDVEVEHIEQVTGGGYE